MENLTISIIVPVYNVEKYIEKCIISILEQTFKDFELLLINDGSTDESLRICELYAAQDSRIRIINKKNGGVNSARNLGLELSRGEFVMFVDSDDYISSDTLRLNLNQITKSGTDIDMVQFPITEIDESGEIINVEAPQPVLISGKENLFVNWFRTNCIIQGYLCGKIFRRVLFESIKLPEDMVITEDAYIVPDLCEIVRTCCISDQGTYFYLRRTSSVTKSVFSPRMKYDFFKTKLKKYKYLKTEFGIKDYGIRYFLEVIRSYLYYSCDNSEPELDNQTIKELSALTPDLSNCIKARLRNTRDILWYTCIYALGTDRFIKLYTQKVRRRISKHKAS